ncbi:hypothetical protein QT397_14775 [Microbulbifer sp. MKSA007]|nr:hypothetical protein QT397_14775 [Microbulbifer sp. MKSA007]
MAKNENTKHRNNHSLYLAKSGYGKTQTLRRRSGIDERGRVILWDPNKDHEADARFTKLSEFFRGLASAERSGKAYRVAYVGDAHPNYFEKWAQAAWSVLDGNRLTYLLVEEYSNCCRTPGTLEIERDYHHRMLWTQARKYGGVIHATSQRPQLITKDALGNAGHIWAGRMDSRAARAVADEIDVPWQEFKSMDVGQFYYRAEGGEAEKIQVFTPI